MKGVILSLLLVLGLALASEPLTDLKLKKKRALRETREFRQTVRELLEEEFIEVAPGIKVKRGCRIERGVASWYGGRFHGRKTSSGEVYDFFKFTAASRTFPLGTYVLVRNEENSKVIAVRINDRGPHINGRIIDLSRAAAYKLGMMPDGMAMVQVIPLRCLSPESLSRYYDDIILDIANTF